VEWKGTYLEIQQRGHLKVDLGFIRDRGRRFWNGIKLSEGFFGGIVRGIGSCSIALDVSNL
jgi:hypothetical protein